MTVESSVDPSRKLNSVQFLRGVAALLVVLYHLVNTAAFGWIGAEGDVEGAAALFDAVGFAGVDLFFVISGVVMVVTCYDRFGQSRTVLPFIARRVVRIYPLYWLATLAVLAISWVRPELTARDKFDEATLAKSLLLWPQDEFPVVAVGWTLTYEMFFYLTFAAMLLLPRRALPGALLLWSVVTTVLFMHHRTPVHKVTANGHLALPLYASPLALEFIAGCFIGWFAKRGACAFAGITLALGLSWLVVVGGWVGRNFPQDAQYGLVRASIFGGSAALITYGAIGLELRRRWRVPRWLVFWGDASYSTYLTHMYVLWLVAAATRWGTAATSSLLAGINSSLMTLAAVVMCGLVGASCHVAVERPVHRFFIRRMSAGAKNVTPKRPAI